MRVEKIAEVKIEEGSPAELALQASAAAPARHHRRRIKIIKKLKRNIKKRKRRRKQIKGKVIDGQHEQYALAYGMKMGIVHAVQQARILRQEQEKKYAQDRTGESTFATNEPLDTGDIDLVFNGLTSQWSPVVSNKLTDSDYNPYGVIKMVFPPGQDNPLGHAFKFKDYCPLVFSELRLAFGIDEESYLESICSDIGFIEFISNSKSGQYFFMSSEGSYMIKTQTKAESKILQRMMPRYHRYMLANPGTLITRFFGMHRVKMHHLARQVRFVVMQSVFDTDLPIQLRYDLKGSTYGRSATEEEKRNGDALKDLDFQAAQTKPSSSSSKLQVGSKRKELIMEQMKRDVAFLTDEKIMDYSLLVGVHSVTPVEEPLRHGETAALEEMLSSKLPITVTDGILTSTPCVETAGGKSSALSSGMNKTNKTQKSLSADFNATDSSDGTPAGGTALQNEDATDASNSSESGSQRGSLLLHPRRGSSAARPRQMSLPANLGSGYIDEDDEVDELGTSPSHGRNGNGDYSVHFANEEVDGSPVGARHSGHSGDRGRGGSDPEVMEKMRIEDDNLPVLNKLPLSRPKLSSYAMGHSRRMPQGVHVQGSDWSLDGKQPEHDQVVATSKQPPHTTVFNHHHHTALTAAAEAALVPTDSITGSVTGDGSANETLSNLSKTSAEWYHTMAVRDDWGIPSTALRAHPQYGPYHRQQQRQQLSVAKLQLEQDTAEGAIEITLAGALGVDSNNDQQKLEVYYIGIIDILQQYDTKKTAETFFRSIEVTLKGIPTKEKSISSVSPKQYGQRFLKFMDKGIE